MPTARWSSPILLALFVGSWPCLAQEQPTALVIEDFEKAPGLAWHGLERHEAPGCEGRFAGMLVWDGKQAVAEAPLPQSVNGDAYDRLELLVHAESLPPTTLTIDCLSSQEPRSGFSCKLRVTWNGWQPLAVHRAAFAPFGPAPRWDAIAGIRLTADTVRETNMQGTHVDFDRLALASGPAEQPLILQTFAGEPTDWDGLEYDPVAGLTRWSVDHAGVVSTDRVPRDWSGFEALSFSAYCPRPTGAEFRVVLWSPNPDTPAEEDNYSTSLCANWQGWKEFVIRKSDFCAYGEPRGWEQIDRLSLVGSAPGWNLITRPNTTLDLGEMRLLPPTMPPPAGIVLFSDARCDAPLWPGLELPEPGQPTLPQPAIWRGGRNRMASYVLPTHDWSGMERLEFCLLAPSEVRLRVWLFSEDPATPGDDCFYAEKTVKADTGHYQVVPFMALEFEARGSPIGLQQIDGLAVKLGGAVDPDTALRVARIEVR